MTWLALGFLAGVALGVLVDYTSTRRWRRRDAYRAHIQAVANRRQMSDALANTRIEAVIERSRGRAS